MSVSAATQCELLTTGAVFGVVPLTPNLSRLPSFMPNPACPACTLEDILSHTEHWECATCGHEWAAEAAPEAARVVKDANGNVLADGDTVALSKDLKLGSGAQVLKAGTKARNIRLQEGDHEIACKVEGMPLALKACFVKKV